MVKSNWPTRVEFWKNLVRVATRVVPSWKIQLVLVILVVTRVGSSIWLDHKTRLDSSYNSRRLDPDFTYSKTLFRTLLTQLGRFLNPTRVHTLLESARRVALGHHSLATLVRDDQLNPPRAPRNRLARQRRLAFLLYLTSRNSLRSTKIYFQFEPQVEYSITQKI